MMSKLRRAGEKSSPRTGAIFNLVARPIVVAFGLAVVLATGGGAFADQPVAKEAAVKAMKGMEQLIRSAKWQIETTSGKIVPPYTDKEYSREKARGLVRSYVVAEPVSGRYRFDQEIVAAVSQRSDAAAQESNEPLPPTVALRLSYSYDGKREREFKASKMGDALPAPEEPGLGEIRKPTGKAYKDNILQNGAAFFPGVFWGQPFSEFLENTRGSVSITDDEHGKWSLKLPDSHAGGDSEIVTYDLDKGGVITAIDVYQGEKLFRSYRVQFQRLTDGFWVPKSSLWYAVTVGRCEQCQFSDVVVNPEVNPNLFAVHFPPGTRVADADQEGRVFTVGYGPEGDLAAIKSFIEEKGFKYDFPPAPGNLSGDTTKPRSMVVWLAIVGVALSFVLLLVAWVNRRRKSKGGATTSSCAAIVVLALWAQNIAAQGASPQEANAAQDYKMSQCGYNVTAFTLEYFKIKCIPNSVYDVLEPTEQGVQFSKIKEVLSAHGLEAAFRQKVTGADLKDSVKPGTLAIFPIKLKGELEEYHYVIVAFHPKEGATLVDAPVKVSAFDPEKVTAVLQEVGGLVLYVRQPKPDRKESMADQITLSPDSQDLGSFTTDEDKQIAVKLHNKGKNLVFLSGVETPCSCMRAVWKPVLLRPDGDLDVTIRVSLRRWPSNATERRIAFSFPDGSSSPLLIKGVKAIDPNNVISADPSEIRIDVTTLRIGSPLVKGVAFSTPAKYHGDLNYESTADWLTVLKDKHDGSLVKLRIDPDPSLFVRGNEVEGRLMANTEDGSLATEVKVVLYRKPFFACSPVLISINRSMPSAQTIVVSPTGQSVGRLKSVKLVTSSKAIKADVTSKGDGSLEIQMTPSPDLSRGVHFLDCLIESEGGQRASAYLPIYVRD